MKTIRRLVYRIRGFLAGPRADADLADEIELHIEMQTDENLRAGMSPEAARRTAVLRFGAIDSIKDAYRDQRTVPFLESFLADVRYALRGLRKNPGFTAVAVAILTLGIGVNTAVFTLTNAILFKGFPYLDNNDRFLYVQTQHPGNSQDRSSSLPDVQDWRAQAKSFEGMAVVNGAGRISLNGSPERYLASQISANTFQLIGQRPLLGRDFASSDETPGAAPVVIMGYSIWERRYGRDPAIIGQTVRLNGAPTTVIGVMGQGSSFPYDEVLWLPVVETAELQKREARALFLCIGRLAEEATVKSARVEMEAIGRRLASAYPSTN